MKNIRTMLLGPETLQICNGALTCTTPAIHSGRRQNVEQVTHIAYQVVCL
jgi:hypothetical protein